MTPAQRNTDHLENEEGGAVQTTAPDSLVSTRTYVLDTSVLLNDPRALFRFAEHAVVIPVVVITELEKKRHDPEIGYFARQALRFLDELRIKHERLDFPIAIGEAEARCASSSITRT